MSLFRKPRSPFWWYTFYFQGKRYRASTRKATKAAAATVEAEALASLNAGIATFDKTRKPPTLREFSVRFLEWVDNSQQLEPNTRRFYRYGWRLIGFTRLPSMALDQITTEIVDCTKFCRPVIDRKTNKPTEDIVECSRTYVNQALRTLKVMMGNAQTWKVINQAPKIHVVKANRRQRMVDADSESKLQSAYQSPMKHKRTIHLREQAWLFFVILQDTGMRPDEVYPMRIEDIHWNDGLIWIPSGKTENARRFVPMSDRVFQMLRLWCEDREGWVFPSKRAACGHLTTIAKGFQAARKRTGVDFRIVPYSARHTYATHTLAATGNIFAVSKAMGHGSIKSMEDYQHPDTAMLADAINQRNNKRSPKVGHTFGHTANAIQ